MADIRVESGRKPGFVLPDSAWSWLIVLGNIIIGMTTIGFFRTIPVFFHSIILEFDLEYADVASIPGLFCFGGATGSFFLPVLTRKFGRQRICIAAGFLLGSANVVSAFSYSFVLMQICTGFVSGIATGILNFTMISSSSQYFLKHRAKATGISTLGIPLGPLILAPVTDRLIDTFGWRGALLILAGVVMNSCVSASLYRPVVLPEPIRKKSFVKNDSESRRNSKSRTCKDAQNLTRVEANCNEISRPEDHSPAHKNSNMGDMSRKKGFWFLAKKKIEAAIDYRLFASISYDIGLLSSVFYFSGYVTTNTFIVPLARDYIGLSSFQASTILSMIGAAECVSKVITGYMADFKRINKCILLAVMAVMCSLTIVGMALCKSYISLAVVAFGYGLCVTAYMGIIVVIFCDIVGPHKIATAVGYQGAIYNCFLAPCLFLMGRLVDATGDARRTFYTCAGLVSLTAVCLMIIYWLQRRKKILKDKLVAEELKEITE